MPVVFICVSVLCSSEYHSQHCYIIISFYFCRRLTFMIILNLLSDVKCDVWKEIYLLTSWYFGNRTSRHIQNIILYWDIIWNNFIFWQKCTKSVKISWLTPILVANINYGYLIEHVFTVNLFSPEFVSLTYCLKYFNTVYNINNKPSKVMRNQIRNIYGQLITTH